MSKLAHRYNKYELEILLACIKPVERWTTSERAAWLKGQVGFRHYSAGNITPIEHYRPKSRQRLDTVATAKAQSAYVRRR